MGNWLKMGQLAFAMIFVRVLRLFVKHHFDFLKLEMNRTQSRWFLKSYEFPS